MAVSGPHSLFVHVLRRASRSANIIYGLKQKHISGLGGPALRKLKALPIEFEKENEINVVKRCSQKGSVQDVWPKIDEICSDEDQYMIQQFEIEEWMVPFLTLPKWDEESTYVPWAVMLYKMGLTNYGKLPLGFTPDAAGYVSMRCVPDFSFYITKPGHELITSSIIEGKVAVAEGGRLEHADRVYPEILLQALFAMVQLKRRGFECVDAGGDEGIDYQHAFDTLLYVGSSVSAVRVLCTDQYLHAFERVEVLPTNEVSIIKHPNTTPDILGMEIIGLRHNQKELVRWARYLSRRGSESGFAYTF